MTTQDETPDRASEIGAEPQAALELRGLTHRYRGAERDAVADVSLSVHVGESFALLGPNGGGKTTTFRILATLLASSHAQPGVASVLGHDVMQAPAQARQALGVVFQSPSLDPQLTAVENLRCHARLYGLSRRDAADRSSQLLADFGLAERGDDSVATFSGGMQRKLEIAKAMLHRPAVLLMDEPSTGLDPAARRDMWRRVDELRRSDGITCIWTTHLMDEAERADRVAILSEGKLLAVDTPANLRATIGGQVVTVEPMDPAGLITLRDRIEDTFGPWREADRPVVVGSAVHFTVADSAGGDTLLSRLRDALPEAPRRVSIGQPTLEEAFLRLTRRDDADPAEASSHDLSSPALGDPAASPAQPLPA